MQDSSVVYFMTASRKVVGLNPKVCTLSVGILDHKPNPYLFHHDLCLICTGSLFGSNCPPNASAVNRSLIAVCS